MEFKKLALAAAVASLPATGFSMEAMEDSALSGVTGQDGISMTLNGNITTDVWIEDTDGLDGLDGNAGFMTIEGLGVNLNNVTVDIDAGSAGGTGAGTGVLQVAIGVPNDITINNLSIGVQGSSAATAGAAADNSRLGLITDSTQVISVGTVTLSASDLVLQLGPDAGTPAAGGSNLLELSGTVGVSLTNVDIFGGTSNTGWIGADSIVVSNVDLTGTTANLNASGLLVTVGASATDVGVDISRLTLGDDTQAALGNVYLDGLNLAGTTVAISGH
ncbi:MAG: hypothetical protein P1U59_07080 [Alcanivorax sp.]|jgi:hypothetical protein|uniref:DUF6160 family protein n=1 Tax=Alcanivorax sp. TaxID=1872427 RepID=UPI00260AAA1C|nr:DUF6160 family protein [Alcanivorax sp.]MDF1724267.1 hypothetical protein [Alcanivorax sp.]